MGPPPFQRTSATLRIGCRRQRGCSTASFAHTTSPTWFTFLGPARQVFSLIPKQVLSLLIEVAFSRHHDASEYRRSNQCDGYMPSWPNPIPIGRRTAQPCRQHSLVNKPIALRIVTTMLIGASLCWKPDKNQGLHGLGAWKVMSTGFIIGVSADPLEYLSNEFRSTQDFQSSPRISNIILPSRQGKSLILELSSLYTVPY